MFSPIKFKSGVFCFGRFFSALWRTGRFVLLILSPIFISLQFVSSGQAQTLKISSEEISPDQEPKTLIIGVSDWAPYSGYDLPGHGFLTEVIQVAMKRAGYKTIAQQTPWARVIKSASRGEIDIIPGIWFSDERAETILYGTILATARLVLISRLDHPQKIETLDDLDKLTVGVVQDYAYPAFFMQAKNFDRDLSRNLDLNLIKLAKGRIDAVLGDELVPQIGRASCRERV